MDLLLKVIEEAPALKENGGDGDGDGSSRVNVHLHHHHHHHHYYHDDDDVVVLEEEVVDTQVLCVDDSEFPHWVREREINVHKMMMMTIDSSVSISQSTANVLLDQVALSMGSGGGRFSTSYNMKGTLQNQLLIHLLSSSSSSSSKIKVPVFSAEQIKNLTMSKDLFHDIKWGEVYAFDMLSTEDCNKVFKYDSVVSLETERVMRWVRIATEKLEWLAGVRSIIHCLRVHTTAATTTPLPIWKNTNHRKIIYTLDHGKYTRFVIHYRHVDSYNMSNHKKQQKKINRKRKISEII
jgi:hypothetical protein